MISKFEAILDLKKSVKFVCLKENTIFRSKNVSGRFNFGVNLAAVLILEKLERVS